METLFTSCFVIGVVITVLSFIVGSAFDIAGVDGIDLDVAGVDINIPLSPVVYLSFLTVFGATGMILLKNSDCSNGVVLLISAVAGVVVATVLYKGIVSPLKRAQNTSAPDREELIGLMAEVNETILPGRFGEIRYTIHGNSFTSPAKCVNEEIKLKEGTKVTICLIKDEVYYVTLKTEKENDAQSKDE
ncbi:MAG: hypothetical protein IJD02_01190 [Lachnospiraceae bacterium]|nr:hypothetical protein [Lachnospiraceae bacterium]